MDRHLIEVIYEAMTSDTDGNERQSARLKCLYNEAGPVGKWHINEAMMCICGWTMDTLIEETMKKEDEHEM